MTSIYWLGAHKTATTFLQKSLDLSGDVLVGNGVKYVELEEFRDRYTRPVLNAEPDHDPAPTVFDGDEPVKLVFDENIPGYVQHALSTEGFYPDAIPRLQAITRHLGLPVDEIVLGVRNYATYLPSLYCETLKSTPFRTFEEYLRSAFDGSERFERMNWYALVRRFAEAYPSTRVRVYFHEDLRGHEAELLEAVLGIPAEDFTLVTESERVGFSGRAVEELHLINTHRTVERKDVGAAVRRYPRNAGHPAFAPWGAEDREVLRANYERDRAWIMSDDAIDVIEFVDSTQTSVPLEETDPEHVTQRDKASPAAPPARRPTFGSVGSMPHAPDLSVVVPVHNAAGSVGDLVKTLLATPDLHIQVILVDDHSSDDSGGVIDSLAESDRVLAFHHDRNLGAGVARNTGFKAVIGRYCLFFDADDTIHTDALLKAIPDLDGTGADIAMMPYHYQRGDQSHHVEMNTYDLETWVEYVGRAPRRFGTLDDLPRLLGFSNYPWNKILRTETYRRAGLKFGTTPVHNDILGHWYSLLFARTILLVNREVCTHVVPGGARNLTNRHSRVRLALFDALDETYDLLEDNPELRNRYSHHYWSTVLRVAGWAGERIEAGHRNEFKLRLQEHLLRANLADFTRIRLRRDPALADAILSKALA